MKGDERIYIYKIHRRWKSKVKTIYLNINRIIDAQIDEKEI